MDEFLKVPNSIKCDIISKCFLINNHYGHIITSDLTNVK